MLLSRVREKTLVIVQVLCSVRVESMTHLPSTVGALLLVFGTTAGMAYSPTTFSRVSAYAPIACGRGVSVRACQNPLRLKHMGRCKTRLCGPRGILRRGAIQIETAPRMNTGEDQEDRGTRAKGPTLDQVSSASRDEGCLSGLVVAVTGNFDKKRPQVEQRVKAQGAVFSGTVLMCSSVVKLP